MCRISAGKSVSAGKSKCWSKIGITFLWWSKAHRSWNKNYKLRFSRKISAVQFCVFRRFKIIVYRKHGAVKMDGTSPKHFIEWRRSNYARCTSKVELKAKLSSHRQSINKASSKPLYVSNLHSCDHWTIYPKNLALIQEWNALLLGYFSTMMNQIYQHIAYQHRWIPAIAIVCNYNITTADIREL